MVGDMFRRKNKEAYQLSVGESGGRLSQDSHVSGLCVVAPTNEVRSLPEGAGLGGVH